MEFIRFRAYRVALLAAAAAVLGGFAPPPAGMAGPPAAGGEVAAAERAGHVVVISIDGLRPDAIERFRAETLQRLMRQGSYSLEAQTILPSLTLPSHTSMLTGLEPEGHGITWNRNRVDDHGHSVAPTVFALARASGLQTAAFFSKGKFHHLAAPGTLDHVRVPAGNGRWSSDRTAALVEEFLTANRPNLMFVHLGDVDAAGHTFSWMSWFYGRAVRRADRAVARILQAADRAFGEGDYTVIVTADHGGHGWSHGSSDPRDVTIPWIAWGDRAREGAVLPKGIRTIDTAATTLWLLGLASETEGRAVETAFVPGSSLSGTAAGLPEGHFDHR